MTPNNPKFDGLIGNLDLCNLISEPTFSKSINSTCTDNFLTNITTRFLKTLAFETGISDLHSLIATMLRPAFTNGKSNKIFHLCYKNFGNEKFQEELKKQLLSVLDFETFLLVFKFTLN